MMFEKLFKWNVPQALTSADWRSWHVNQRRERPVAYWFCETLPPCAQNRVIMKLIHVIQFRVILKAGLVLSTTTPYSFYVLLKSPCGGSFRKKGAD